MRRLGGGPCRWETQPWHTRLTFWGNARYDHKFDETPDCAKWLIFFRSWKAQDICKSSAFSWHQGWVGKCFYLIPISVRAAQLTNWTYRLWNVGSTIRYPLISVDEMIRSISTTVVVAFGGNVSWVSIRRDVHCHLHSESVRRQFLRWNQSLPRIPRVWHGFSMF